MEAVISLFAYCALFVLFLVTFGLLVRFILIVSDIVRRYRHKRLLQSYGVSSAAAKIYVDIIFDSYSRGSAIAERLKSYYNIPPEVVERVMER